MDTQFPSPGPEKRLSQSPHKVGSIYDKWLQHNWRHPAFDFIQEAFDDYLAERYDIARSIVGSYRFHYNHSANGNTSYVSLNYASRLLEALPITVEELISSGELTPKYMTEEKAFAFIKETDVLAFRSSWISLVELDQVAAILGVSEEILLDMVKCGILAAEPSLIGEGVQWKFGLVNPLAFVEIVKDRTEIFTASFTPVSLIGAARILKVTGLKAASIIARVAEGRLRAYHEPRRPFACQDLLFNPVDLYDCIELVKAENGWVERRQAAKILGVRDSTLAKWLGTGLLAPIATYANRQYFDRGEVEKFFTDYITSGEAAKLLGIEESLVRKLARRGFLEVVSGPEIDGCTTSRFEREYLLQWRYGHPSVGSYSSAFK